MRKFFVLFLSSLFLLSSAISPSSADPARLFNEAAGNAGQLNQNVPLEQRLKLYKNIFEALDQIIAEYPSSQEALRLLTGQAAGNFNPSKLRSDYITELNRYYNTVCEVNPSYTCLGFVSLNIGYNECQKAQTFSELDRAHRHIQNAARIFHQQKEDKSIISVALGAYNQCSAGRPNLSRWHRDYFQSKLVQIMLDVGEQNTAKAMIQRMETPFFKFEGVLTLKTLSGQPADNDYLQRLERYIEENLAPKERESSDAFLATMRLRMFAMKSSNHDLDYMYVYEAIQKYRNYGSKASCDRQYVSFLFNLMLDYQIALMDVPKRGPKAANAAQVRNLILMAAERPDDVFKTCADKEFYDLSLMASIHGLLLTDMGRDVAQQFRDEIERRAMSREDLVTYYLNVTKPNVANVTKIYFDERNPVPGRSKRGGLIICMSGEAACGTPHIIGSLKTPEPHAIYPVYKWLVDNGEVCKSATLLFRQLSKTGRYNEAIGYMINSPAIDATKAHKCGDAELELLLK